MITTVIFIVSLGLNVALSFATFNLLRKLENYEKSIEEFYSALSITLQTMRAIDERQMFEKDDEVGTVFGQLTEVINDLRPFIYGTADEQTKK